MYDQRKIAQYITRSSALGRNSGNVRLCPAMGSMMVRSHR